MDSGAGVCFQVVHRTAASFCLALVGVLNTLTDAYLSPVQGFCLAVLVFILAEVCSKRGGVIKLKLFKRVCLLYSNERARSLVTFGDSEAAALANLFLAIAIAVLLMIGAEKKKDSSGDLAMLLTGIMYLYGDMFSFLLGYGVFTVTVSALFLGFWLDTWKEPPKDRIYAFIWQLTQFVSTNLLHKGVTNMVVSTRELEVLECMAISAILPSFLPSMQSYLTYLAAQRLVVLVPGYAPVFFCLVVWISSCSSLPPSIRGWFSELCFIYVAMTIALAVNFVPIPGIVFVVVLLHYADYLVTVLCETVK